MHLGTSWTEKSTYNAFGCANAQFGLPFVLALGLEFHTVSMQQAKYALVLFSCGSRLHSYNACCRVNIIGA